MSEYPSSEQGTGTLSILRKYANTELALTWQAMYKFPRLRARGIPAILQFSSNQGELIENFCTSYWKLDGTNFVYGRQCWIGYFEGETLKYFDLDQAKEAQLEEIIPALRLLRTPFNGAR